MIAKIDPPSSSFQDIIDYHEEKLEQGKAEFLLNNTFESNPKKYKDAFESVCNLNERVKNKCVHISINYPIGENITNEKHIEIAKEYLEKLGYENNPCLIYKHNDKNHSHVHIVLSSVDFEGSKVNDSFQGLKSQAITRELEEKYNLTPTVYHNFGNKSLNESNAKTYNFQNALKRAFKDPKSKIYLSNIITNDEKKFLLKNPVTNIQASSIFTNRFDELTSYLHKVGYFTTIHKNILLDKLDAIYNKSKNKDDFFQMLEKENIYIRQISDKGKSRYVYGLPEQTAYFKDSRLPKKYSYNDISMHFGPFMGKFIPESEQKHILYNLIVTSHKESNSIGDFMDNIRSGNIDVEQMLDDRGKTKDFKFNFNTEANPKSFLFTEIFPNRNMDQFADSLLLKENQLLDDKSFKEIAIESSTFYPDNSIYTPVSSSPLRGPEDRSFENNVLKKKKKKKPNQREIDNNI